MTKEITIVVPISNESGNIELLQKEVNNVFLDMKKDYTFNLLFVDDGSSDNSVELIQLLSNTHDNINYIELSRNFGKEAALSAGIQQASGDAVVLMDGDLQHPPFVIKEFIKEWEKGIDVVVGVRKRNPDESFFRRKSSQLFTYLMSRISNVSTVSRSTDFRLIDRKVVDEFIKFTERERIVRGLIDWLGFKRSYVLFDARERHAGTAQYGYKKLFGLAISSLTSYSMVPLRLAGYLGIIITFFAGTLGFFILIDQIILSDPLMLEIPATAMLAVMIMFLNGVLLVSIGLVSIYIERIHCEATNRPMFIIRNSSVSLDIDDKK